MKKTPERFSPEIFCFLGLLFLGSGDRNQGQLKRRAALSQTILASSWRGMLRAWAIFSAVWRT